jgi:predicted DNA-binding transcriptional regulator AlpA
MSEQILEQLLDEKELAGLIRVSIGTLRYWRSERQGPPSIKVGHLVRYRPSDVAGWLRSRTLSGNVPVEAGR